MKNIEIVQIVTVNIFSVFLGGHSDNYGHYLWRFWIHAKFWWLGLGSVPVHSARPIPLGTSRNNVLVLPRWTISFEWYVMFIIRKCYNNPVLFMQSKLDSHHSFRPFCIYFETVNWKPFHLFSAIGYFIFRGSNSQKNEFRKNPHNPALARK